MLSHYHATFDPEDENNSHAAMLRLVGYNKRVLEVGCASGHVSARLHERGCRVVGVEIDADVVEPARQWTERVVTGDVAGDTVWEALNGERFDVLLLGDVLEHLLTPLETLRRAVRLLEPSGSVVISVPNITHADVKVALLNGKFPYSDSGLLDATHVHFFTKESLVELVHHAGLVIVDLIRVTAPVFSTEIGVNSNDVSTEVLNALAAERESETYQFVVKAVLDNGARSLAHLSTQVVELTDQLFDNSVALTAITSEHAALRREFADLTTAYEANRNDLDRLLRQRAFVKRLLPRFVLTLERRLLVRSSPLPARTPIETEETPKDQLEG